MSRFQTLYVGVDQTEVPDYKVQNNEVRGDEPREKGPSFRVFHWAMAETFGALPFRGVKR